MTDELVERYISVNVEKGKVVAMKESLEERIIQLNIKIREIGEECDHAYLNGTPAWEVLHPFKVCSVCGWVGHHGE